VLTQEIDEMLRRAELAGTRQGVETVRRLFPEVGAESIEVAGGFARFTGVDSPLSQAVGVGVCVPAGDADVATITEFYESHGATPRVFVTPFADASLGAALAAAGYVPAEYENVLASRDLDTHALYDERVRVAANVEEWAHASARGFVEREAPAPGDEAIALVLASSEGVVPLEVREHETIVATCAMDVREGCSAFFAGSTLPSHRRRGWHRTMIRDRIARAREAGATLLRATAKPGSISERNFQRCGLLTLYTRTLWERKQKR
jgi:GNAT superfamily N-acetyltransferase